MTTLQERLREAGDDYTVEWGSGDLYYEAAERIAALEAQVAAEAKAFDAAETRIVELEAALEEARVALRDARASLHGHGYNAGIIAKVDAVLRAIEETRGC